MTNIGLDIKVVQPKIELEVKTVQPKIELDFNVTKTVFDAITVQDESEGVVVQDVTTLEFDDGRVVNAGSGKAKIVGKAIWGQIEGTLSDQTDLQNALDLKADDSDLTDHIEDTSNPHEVRLDQLEDPEEDSTIAMGGNVITFNFTNPNGGMLFNMTGGWSGHVLNIQDTAVTPSALGDHLFHGETSREYVLPAHFVNNHPDGRALLSEGKTILDGDVEITGDTTGIEWQHIGGNQSDINLSGFTDDMGIGSHIADSSIHFTQAQISITESQISDFQNYALESSFQTHVNDSTIHFTQGDIQIGQSQVNDLESDLSSLQSQIDNLDNSNWEPDGTGFIKPKDDNKVKVEHIDGALTEETDTLQTVTERGNTTNRSLFVTGSETNVFPQIRLFTNNTEGNPHLIVGRDLPTQLKQFNWFSYSPLLVNPELLVGYERKDMNRVASINGHFVIDTFGWGNVAIGTLGEKAIHIDENQDVTIEKDLEVEGDVTVKGESLFEDDVEVEGVLTLPQFGTSSSTPSINFEGGSAYIASTGGFIFTASLGFDGSIRGASGGAHMFASNSFTVPRYSFRGDNGTGMGRTDDQTLALFTDGDVRLEIAPTGEVDVKNDLEISDLNKGVILKSPDGTRWRVQVADDGSLTTEAL